MLRFITISKRLSGGSSSCPLGTLNRSSLCISVVLIITTYSGFHGQTNDSAFALLKHPDSCLHIWSQQRITGIQFGNERID